MTLIRRTNFPNSYLFIMKHCFPLFILDLESNWFLASLGFHLFTIVPIIVFEIHLLPLLAFIELQINLIANSYEYLGQGFSWELSLKTDLNFKAFLVMTLI